MLGRGATIPRDSGAQIGELLGMSLVALDSAKLFILMAAGGSFAIAGLWLLLRPKPAGGARIELFGMKFESSSAGLLVFLIGAGFIATPLFVPERDPQASTTHASTNGAPIEGGAAADPAVATIPQRARAKEREREPNDGYDGANQIAVGDSVSVASDGKSEDWFVMPVDPDQHTVHVRLRSNANYCYNIAMFAYSEDESQIGGEVYLPSENTAKVVEVSLTGSSFLFLRFDGVPWDCRFEFFTSYSSLQ